MEGALKFRQKLEKGQVCLGAGITFSDPLITEVLGKWVDFFWIDCEHTPITLDVLSGHLLAARSKGVCAIVRVAGSETHLIKPVIDSGADGIMIPQIRSAEEARKVVDNCRYAPLGNRGFGGSATYNCNPGNAREYLDYANANLFVSVQIETAEALEDIDNILAIPSLDSVVIGPYDLSGALGVLGDVENPKVVRAIKTIVAKSKKAGVFVGSGMGLPDREYGCQMIEWGIQWFQICNDYGLLVNCMDWIDSAMRSRLGEKRKQR